MSFLHVMEAQSEEIRSSPFCSESQTLAVDERDMAAYQVVPYVWQYWSIMLSTLARLAGLFLDRAFLDCSHYSCGDLTIISPTIISDNQALFVFNKSCQGGDI